MNWELIKNLPKSIKDLLQSFFNYYNWVITFFLGIIVTTLTTCLNNPYFWWLIIVTIISFIIIFIYLAYYTLKIYVSITPKTKKYYMHYLNPPKNYLFETSSLMLDNSFSTKLSFEIELGPFIQNKLKNNSIPYYTLVIEKDKSIEVNIEPEDIDEKEDNEYSNRNEPYYYFVQEYTGQNTLKFNINFKGFNKKNINKKCKIYLEYGDIHENNDRKFRNNFINEEFFTTDLSSILK